MSGPGEDVTAAGTDDAPPWEPPWAGGADEHLLGSLDRLRWTFRWKADGLDADGLATTVGASTLTLGGLLVHLAAVEAVYSTWLAFGEDPGLPWTGFDTEGSDFAAAAGWTPEQLYGRYDSEVARARARIDRALADGGLDQPAVQKVDRAGRHASLRRLLADLVEEYGRHTGHADLLREAVDGRVGEDPPSDWRP